MKCPTCGQNIREPYKPKRICAKCNQVIGKGHKWHFREDGRIEHRVCSEPDSYRKGDL